MKTKDNKMLVNQKNKFVLEAHAAYLNGAYMSPLLKSVIQVGQEAIAGKGQPYKMDVAEFFNIPKRLKKNFAQLVDIPNYQNIAIIPAVSYGIATVANNIELESGEEILIVEGQFPSQVYSWLRLTQKQGGKLVIIDAPSVFVNRGKKWNEAILAAISSKTAVVSLPHVHWADGTLFDLKAIRAKTKLHGAKLIIDGTQSVGALSFSVREYAPDALITGGYKWLLGPYSTGLAYYNDSFSDGHPIEENWINRKNSEDFTKLVNYQPEYQPKSGRFSVGESSNFALNPMLNKAIEQLIDWQPKEIQNYCVQITEDAIQSLQEMGCYIEEESFRTSHLFGIYLPKHIPIDALKEKLLARGIFVSYRGNAVRVSPNVYNSWDDLERLVQVFRSF